MNIIKEERRKNSIFAKLSSLTENLFVGKTEAADTADIYVFQNQCKLITIVSQAPLYHNNAHISKFDALCTDS